MNNEDDTVQVDLRGLDNFIHALKGQLPVGRIGVLGGDKRKGKGPTNAEVGAAHEFGTSTLPQRSWLRMPLIGHLDSYLEKSGLFDEDLLNKVIKESSVKALVEKIMIVAERVVADAFGSNGFGKWRAWSGGYQSNTGNVLVDSQQLRNSVTSEVVE